MIDGSIVGIMNMTDDIGTVLYVLKRKKNLSQTVYRFYGFQHSISFQSRLGKFSKRQISEMPHLPFLLILSITITSKINLALLLLQIKK